MAHRSPITCVDHHPASPVGEVLVTGGYDGRVVCWQQGRERWEETFDDLVNDVRVDPSGRRVAVAVADRHTFVLDVATGARLDVLGPHGDDVNAVRWSPDGTRLVSVMDHLDTVVRVWEQAADGTWADRPLVGHRSGVFAAAFDPTGRFLATVAEDATGRIWDLEGGEQVHVLEHPGDPEAMDWSPDGSVVVTGCDDGVARVWDPVSGALVHELHEATAAVRFLRFDRTGRRLLAGAYDATMRVYRCADWSVTETFTGPFQWERAACFTTDGIVIGGFTGAPFAYPRAEGEPPVLTFGVNALCVAGDALLAGRDDGAVVDVLRGAVLARHDTIVNTVSASPDRSLVASADYRGVVRLTTPDGGRSTEARADGGGPINSIAWHPSGTHLFTGGYDGVVRRWTVDGGTATCVARWVAHHGPIKSLAWSAAAGLLVAGSSDGTLSAWDGPTDAWRADADDLVLVNAVAAADADGDGVVVSASRDLIVRRWDARTGALLECLPHGHTKSVKAVAVTPDGGTVVTGAYDGTAILWSRGDGGTWSWRPLRHHGKPGVPAVGLGGGNAFSAGWNGTVARWTLDGRLVAAYELAEVR